MSRGSVDPLQEPRPVLHGRPTRDGRGPRVGRECVATAPSSLDAGLCYDQSLTYDPSRAAAGAAQHTIAYYCVLLRVMSHCSSTSCCERLQRCCIGSHRRRREATWGCTSFLELRVVRKNSVAVTVALKHT